MGKTVCYNVKNIDTDTLELLRAAKDRMSRELGVPVTMQGLIRKLLNDAADAERALQDAAGEEYAARQADDNRGKV